MKTSVVIAILPYFLALLLFYSLAFHMYQSLNGWPDTIGTNGFPTALLIHDQITSFYTGYLFLFTIFVVPAIILLCLSIPRWRHMAVYLVLHLATLPVYFLLIQFAPEDYLYWWWD